MFFRNRYDVVVMKMKFESAQCIHYRSTPDGITAPDIIVVYIYRILFDGIDSSAYCSLIDICELNKYSGSIGFDGFAILLFQQQ